MKKETVEFFFTQAKPIWANRLEKEKNITLGLYKMISFESGKAVLRVATSGFYKVFLNGDFIYFGPARCAHEYYRVDEIELALEKGENHIAIEVVNYYINSYYSVMQSGFVQSELTVNDTVFAATGVTDENAFELYQLYERIRKTQRYSYQRTFSEAYLLSDDFCNWRTGGKSKNALKQEEVITENKNLLPRYIPLNKFSEVFPESIVGFGTVKTEIKPENYIKDRSLINIKDPSNGNLEGYYEFELQEHLSDEIQEISTQSIINVEKTVYDRKTKLKSNEFEIVSFACEKTGFITADIQCFSSSILYFIFDEILTEHGDVDPLRLKCCNVIKIKFNKGKYHFVSAEPYGFKYLKLLCTAGKIAINNIGIIQTICPVSITFNLKTDNEDINKILDASKETFVQNSFDLLTDCPTRERAGWLCDSFFLGRAEKTFTGKNIIERNFLENFLLTENFKNIPSGMIPMCYPADVDANGFIPNWAMWFIIELKDYKRRTDDDQFIELFKDRVYGLIEWFKQYENADGLLVSLSGWVFVEWSKANDFVQDLNYPTNMLYSSALYDAGELFDDEGLKQKSERIKDIIRERSFDGEFFRDNEVYEDGRLITTENRTETCQYYAFFTGVATKELFPELLEKLVKEFGPNRKKTGVYPEIYPSNAFIGNFLRLELLAQNGIYNQLLNEIKDYFLYMADITGTLWENVSADASCNHGFASYVAELIRLAHSNQESEFGEKSC